MFLVPGWIYAMKNYGKFEGKGGPTQCQTGIPNEVCTLVQSSCFSFRMTFTTLQNVIHVVSDYMFMEL